MIIVTLVLIVLGFFMIDGLNNIAHDIKDFIEYLKDKDEN